MNLPARRRCAVLLLSIVLSMLLGISTGTAQESAAPADVTFEHRIPDTATGVVRIPSVTELRSRLSNCSLGQLARDESLRDLRSTIIGQIRDDLQRSRFLPPGASLEEWFSLATGEVGIASFAPTDGRASVVLSVEFDQTPDSVDALLERMTAAAVTAGWTRSTVAKSIDSNKAVEAADANQSVLRLTRNSTSPRARPARRDREILVVRHESHLIVSNSLAALREVVRRWDGTPAGAFSGQDAWLKIRAGIAASGREPGVLWFVDPVALTGGRDDNPILAALDEFGLAGLKALGGGFDFSAPKFDTSSHVIAVFGSAPNGPIRLASSSLTLPRWAPASSTTALVLNLDLAATWTALKKASESSSPGSPISSIVTSLTSFADRLKLNLADEVIPQFVGPITVLQKPLPRTDMKVPPRNAILLAAEILDVEKARQLLDRVAKQPAGTLTRRTSGETEVFAVETRDKGLVEFAIAHGSVLITNSRSFMDEAIVTGGKVPRLLDDPEFDRLQKSAPADVVLLGTQQTAEQFRLLYELLKLSTPVLPNFETIKHHFRPSATWLRTSDGVVEYVNVTLPPAKE